MSISLLVASSLALASSGSSPLPSHRVDVGRLPMNTNWLIHVDAQALRGTQLWRTVHQMILSDPDVDVDLEELREIEREFGIRPFQDIDAITVYGTEGIGDEAVVQVLTSANLDALIGKVREKSEYRELEHNGYTLHGFAEHGNDIDGLFYVHDLGSQRLIVASESDERVIETLHVLNGQSRSLRQNPDPRIIPQPSPGSFLFVDFSAALSELADWDEASAVAELARAMRLEVGESAGEFFATVDIDTSSAENANNIYSVLNGARALVSLAGTQEDVPPFLMELLASLDLQVTGTAVKVHFHYDSDDLIEELRALEEYDH